MSGKYADEDFHGDGTGSLYMVYWGPWYSGTVHCPRLMPEWFFKVAYCPVVAGWRGLKRRCG